MSDKLPKQYKASVDFTDGEAPLSTKMNVLSTAVKAALTNLERAIGDLWDQSYPYFENADTLSQATTTLIDSNLGNMKKLEIMNLARLIGPASALNPKHLFDMSDSEKEVTVSVPSGKNYFLLKYAPIQLADLTFSETTPTALITRKSTTDDCVDAGDYYVNSLTGEVFTITPTIPSTTATYDGNSYLGFDWYDLCGYPGASFNVIPDPAQATKCSLTGPSGGLYRLTLPLCTDQEFNDNDSSVTLSASDLNYNVQLLLPRVLSNLSAGDIIPSNFLMIRNDTTGKIYPEASYYYVSQSEIDIGGVTLDTTDGYTVITVGTNITQAIQHLQTQMFKLKRGISNTYAIQVDNVVGKTGPTANTGISGAEPYIPSEAPNNHFPQYLHRDGFMGTSYDEDNINDANGMRGDIVLLSKTRTSGSRNNVDDDSYAVIFGKYSEGIKVHRERVSGSVSYLYLDNQKSGEEYTAIFGQAVSAFGGYSCGTPGAANYPPIKFFVVEGTGTLGAVTSDVLEIDLSAYLTGKNYLYATGCLETNVSTIFVSPGDPGSGLAGGLSDRCQLIYNTSTYKLYWSVETGLVWANGNSYDYKVVVYYTE